jgi:MraZ protein
VVVVDLLTGEFKVNLDEKGRLMLPVKLRNGLPGESVILTQGVDRCLWLFPPEQWKALSQKLMETTSLFHARARLVQRRIVAPAQDVEIDKTGRVMVPPSLRDYAGLRKECVILGIDKYVEIWDAEEYKNYLESTEADFKAAAEELEGISL